MFQSCDRIRTALEITDVEKDILGFVQRYGTGTKAPGNLIYYYYIILQLYWTGEKERAKHPLFLLP
jgi:hypothetical protein